MDTGTYVRGTECLPVPGGYNYQKIFYKNYLSILCLVIISMQYFDGLNFLHFIVIQYLGIVIITFNSETGVRNAHLKSLGYAAV